MKSVIINKNRFNRKGLRVGYWEYYYPDGSLCCNGQYVNGVAEGYWEWYHSKGFLYAKGSFVNGFQNDIWEWYKEDGELDFIKNYREGVEI